MFARAQTTTFSRRTDRSPPAVRWSRSQEVGGAKAPLTTRNVLDCTEKFASIAKEAVALPDMMIDGEIVALDHNGAPNFSSLQAALSDGKTDDLIFFAFDLLFVEGLDLRRL